MLRYLELGKLNPAPMSGYEMGPVWTRAASPLTWTSGATSSRPGRRRCWAVEG